MAKSILVINRIGTLRKMTVQLLNELGYSDVVEAPGVKDGLALMRKPSAKGMLVILELSVLGVSSEDLNFLESIKEENRAKVVVTSPNENSQIATQVLDRGATAFIARSFDLDVFSAKLRESLDHAGGDFPGASG
ncbi:hypothetical protein ACFL5V_11035 [Fibrobacterota bacterium]